MTRPTRAFKAVSDDGGGVATADLRRELSESRYDDLFKALCLMDPEAVRDVTSQADGGAFNDKVPGRRLGSHGIVAYAGEFTYVPGVSFPPGSRNAVVGIAAESGRERLVLLGLCIDGKMHWHFWLKDDANPGIEPETMTALRQNVEDVCAKVREILSKLGRVSA